MYMKKWREKYRIESITKKMICKIRLDEVQ